jgi:hypothetical protein
MWVHLWVADSDAEALSQLCQSRRLTPALELPPVKVLCHDQ